MENIGIVGDSGFYRNKLKKAERITATTTDLGNCLNGKLFFVFVMIWQIRRMGLI
ncbi:hypothetical protein J2X17_001384 [Flavobacterium aquidurense]|nr:hypothetical protein [Flavobacterium aquidurense]